jgi:hypothetical protein
VANPVYVTLVSDVETELDLDANYGRVEVTIVANAATTYFNATNTPIGPVAGSQDGNHLLSATLISKTVVDGTGGTASTVRLRSSGTPTVEVYGR